ncbi:radical SAM protein [Eubacterium sp. 1001713B170207_170306_E7]|uniref:radical SAM protein n=1 Tax=Eubacterium sp. 1001713B170207_170306_E7 TaxID=2787097 RepID=UPI00189AB5BA|nr:radical SAM protein [Eubacterium sp. 1001713B170207_170306_E7]
MKFEERYSRLPEDALPQEIVLLMGRGCFWKKCSFCDYHMDSGPDSVSIALNDRVLDQVTGALGRLVVLNSGSYFELPGVTRKRVLEICRQKAICHLHMESHWLLHKQTRALKDELAKEGICLHPRIGIETFDEQYREEIMLKGMGYDLPPESIAEIYDECCLLFGMTGQSPDQFEQDIATATEYFSRVYVNIFNDNSTPVKADPELLRWFAEYSLPELQKNPKICVLINNTDLGVGD